VRRFAIAEAVFLVVTAITPCWAASPEPDIHVPNAVDPMQWNDAQAILSKTSAVIARFKSEPKMAALARQAQGIFVVPQFGHGTSPTTASWGSGVLLASDHGQWSDPVFFTLGGGSLGPHVTANGGALILFVMTDRAMAKFKKISNWSLSSAPGTAIVSYSAATPQDLSGHGSDIVAWSAAGGANADTELSITDIGFDMALNSTVYGTPDLRSILANEAPYINQTVINLRREMPSTAIATTPNVQDPPLRRG